MILTRWRTWRQPNNRPLQLGGRAELLAEQHGPTFGGEWERVHGDTLIPAEAAISSCHAGQRRSW